MIANAPFGRTGHESSRAIFGAAALSDVTQEAADRAVRAALDAGVNHVDTAASYGDAELRLAPWIERYRDDLFLATKTGERRKGPAADEIRRSLERMRTDHVDLIQLHNLVDEAEWEVALGPVGALEAAIEARNVAVQTIKAVTRRPWGPRPQDRATWYQPLEDPDAIRLSVHWVLGRPGVFLNTVGDVDVLPKVLEAAASFERRPDDDAMRRLAETQAMEPLFT